MNTANSLLEKIEHALELDFGVIFGDSIEFFKKTWLQGFLLQLFTLFIILPVIVAFYIPLIIMVIAEQETGYNDFDTFNGFYRGMSVFYISSILLAVFIIGTLITALKASFFKIMRKLDNNEGVTTSDFFYFFKRKYLSKILVLTLVSILIVIPSALLCYLPLIYMLVPLSFFTIIFAFNPELSVRDIVKVSFKLANKKWLISFGLIVVSSILSTILGYIVCGVGLLFTYAFVYHPIYFIYKEVIGFNEQSVIDQIGITPVE